MAEIIKIVITDDHALVRKGLRMLLETETDIQVVGEATNGDEAIAAVARLQPQVILMDLIMPVKDGIQATLEIHRKYPNTRVLVLTSFVDDAQIFPAIKAGALGYILKDTLPHELIGAIRDVAAGRPALHPNVAARLMQEVGHERAEEPISRLTEREVEVLKHIAHGLTNQEIAQEMHLSERTVTSYVSNILEKLNLENRTQAALYALREGLASLFVDSSQ